MSNLRNNPLEITPVVDEFGLLLEWHRTTTVVLLCCGRRYYSVIHFLSMLLFSMDQFIGCGLSIQLAAEVLVLDDKSLDIIVLDQGKGDNEGEAR